MSEESSVTADVHIDVYGPTSKISGPYPKSAVRMVTSYPVEGAQFSQSYRKGVWDGRKHLFRLTSETFPTGLLSLVKEACELAGANVIVTDHRTSPQPRSGSFDLVGVRMDGKYAYQLEAAKKAVEAKRGVLRMATNAGKCLHPDTPVMLFDGSVAAAKNIRVGNLLMGPDSLPRAVQSTCTGTGPMYRIVPNLGDPWICNDVHVLTLRDSRRTGKHANEVVDIELPEYFKLSTNRRRLLKQFSTGVNYPAIPDPSIDPYFLGVWFGDGCKDLKQGVQVTTMDSEIVDLLSNTCKSWSLNLVKYASESSGRADTYALVTPRGETNPLLTEMRRVCGDASTLPLSCLRGSERVRLLFLAGLLDTDGHLEVNSKWFEITQVRATYAEGIRDLARSLGFRVNVKPKVVNGVTYHRLHIYGDLHKIPTRLPRKQAKKRKQPYRLNTGFRVEPLGVGDYAGFTLDGDGRFLLGDFTVTHNTEVACAITRYLEMPTIFMVTTRELLHQSRARFMKRLGATEEEIGIVGDGVWNPGTWVTIATVDTLESRFEQQSCQDLLKGCEVLFVDECVDEYSVISTESGYSYAKDIKVGDVVVTHSGMKPVTRVTTHTREGVKLHASDGLSLLCSVEHPIAVVRNGKLTYVYADSVSVDDVLLERMSPSRPLADFSLSAYLAGLFAGGGHWHSTNKVRFSYRKDFEFWETVVPSLLTKAYPDSSTCVSTNARGGHTLTVLSDAFLLDLAALGFSVRQNKYKHLPLHPNMRSYISGLFDAKGFVDLKSNRCGIQTTCYELTVALQRFLRDNNIAARLQVCPKKSHQNPGYRVAVPSVSTTEFFSLCPGFLPRKQLASKGHGRLPSVFDSEVTAIASSVNARPVLVTKVDTGLSLNTVEFEVEEDHTFVANGLLTHNCHHAGSETWYDVCTACPANYRYGLSGTPMDRTDGANLRLLATIGPVIVDIPNKFLVENGISAKTYVIFSKITAPVLPKKLAYASAYKQGVVDNPNALNLIVEWTKVFQEVGLSTLILCEQIEHGKAIDQALWTATGDVFIPHLFIHGEEATEVRANALKDFGERKLPVLVASTILDEGVDVPTIDALILAGSRKSRIKTMQRLGRGLRGSKLIAVEFANFTNDYLLKHSLERWEDYKKEECFPLIQSGPDVALVRKIWTQDAESNGPPPRR